MKVFLIGCLLVSLHFLIFIKDIQCSPITDKIYNYKGIKISDECKDKIRENKLLRPEQLPAFRDMQPTDIEAAYRCAKKFYKENAKKLDSLSESEKSAFASVIKAPLYFIRLIKETLLKNNVTNDLIKMDNRLDTIDDEYQKFHSSYYELCRKYNDNLNEAKKRLGLLIYKPLFEDASNYHKSDLDQWRREAMERGYIFSENIDPMHLNYQSLDYVGRTTSSTKFRQYVNRVLSRVGHWGNFNNEDNVNDLRMLYNRKDKFPNVVFKKMDSCMAKNFDSANNFLYEVERNLTENLNDCIFPAKEYRRATLLINKIMYFPHKHVINTLFEIINKNFQIFIKECKDQYQIYTEGMRLYEVHVSNEKVGLFYIDYFAKDQKVAPTEYTDVLRYRVKDLNIIPIAFISLQNESQEKFTLDEVRALFHEMGHCLQFILSDGQKIWKSFDTIEFPAMFMQFFTHQEKYILELCAEKESERINPKTYRKYNNVLHHVERIYTIESLHEYITDLNIFARPQDDLNIIIAEARYKFKYKRTCDRTFRSRLLEYQYAGSYYSYILSEFLAIDAYDYLNSDPSKFEERILKFRRLVFEMKDVNTLGEAFQAFVGRKEINVEPFYKFYGITSHKGLISI